MQLAPSAFLASIAACSDLIHQILPERLFGMQHTFRMTLLICGINVMKLHLQKELLSRFGTYREIPFSSGCIQSAANDAQSEVSWTHLLAVAGKESGAGLIAVPVMPLGFRMEDKILRITGGLRIGVPQVQPNCVVIVVNRLMLREHIVWVAVEARVIIQGRPLYSKCGGQEKFGLCKDPTSIRTQWSAEVRRQMARWHWFGPMEVRSIISVGCHMTRYLCSTSFGFGCC